MSRWLIPLLTPLMACLLVGALPAQPPSASPTPRATPRDPEERRSEYRRRLELNWKEAEKDPSLAVKRLRDLLAGPGLVGPRGPGPQVAVAASSPRATEVALTALLALQRKRGWSGHVHGLADDSHTPPTLLVVGVTDQLRRSGLTVHKPFLSSLQVVNVQAPAAMSNRFQLFTELSLASQLFDCSEDVELRLERLRPEGVQYSLKCYDLRSHQAFLDQLKHWIDTEADGMELKVTTPFLQGLPQRSAALRLRSLAMREWPEQWQEAPRLDFFEPGQPVPPPGVELVNLWVSQDMSGPDAAEKVYYALLELLDSTPDHSR